MLIISNIQPKKVTNKSLNEQKVIRLVKVYRKFC